MPPLHSTILTVGDYQHTIQNGADYIEIGKRPRLLTHSCLARERFPPINMPAICKEYALANQIPEWTLPAAVLPVTRQFVIDTLLDPLPPQLPVRCPVFVDIANIPLDQVTYEHWKSPINGFLLLVTKQYGHQIKNQDIGIISVYKQPIKKTLRAEC